MFSVWLSLCILLCANIVDCRQFRFDYKLYQDVDGWYKLHQIPATWEDARLRCKLEGATLASPQTRKMAAVMRNVMQNTYAASCGVYTGIHATFSGGDFHTVDGLPISKIPISWMPNEPDNQNNNENCIVFLANGTAADVTCNEAFPYMCFKKRTKNLILTECGTIDREYTLEPRTGSCYKFHNIARNWTRAFMACAAEGAHLAIINSELESTVLSEIFGKHPGDTLRFTSHRDIAFIGFHDWEEFGVWTTIDGQSIEEAGFNTFEKGQPDNAAPGEHCGGIFRSGKLDDAWCNERMVFICEKSPDSLQEEVEFK